MSHYKITVAFLLILGITFAQEFDLNSNVGSGVAGQVPKFDTFDPSSLFQFSKIEPTSVREVTQPERRLTARARTSPVEVDTSQRTSRGRSPIPVSPFQPVERRPAEVSVFSPRGIFTNRESLRDRTESLAQQPQTSRGRKPKPSQVEIEDFNDEKENLVEPVIGVSPCARGVIGDKCREHLQATAMACTSGKCFECQSCDSLKPSSWVGCCRDHFLCCRKIAKACQACDRPDLNPFCRKAFGRCHEE